MRNWSTGIWTTRKMTLCWTARKMTWSRTTRKRTVIRKKQGEVGDALLAADEGTSWSGIKARPSSACLLMALWQYCVHHIFFINFLWRRFPPKRVSSFTILFWTMFSDTWLKKKNPHLFPTVHLRRCCFPLCWTAQFRSAQCKMVSTRSAKARLAPPHLWKNSTALPLKETSVPRKVLQKAPLHTPQSELALYAWCTPSRLFNTNVKD